MRDCVDCVNAFDLPEFSKEVLKKGWSKKMEIAARDVLKLNSVS